MKCSNCGHELQEGMKFCPECGIRIKGAKVINAPSSRSAAQAAASLESLSVPAGAPGAAAQEKAQEQAAAAEQEPSRTDAAEAAPAAPAAPEEGSVPDFLRAEKAVPEPEVPAGPSEEPEEAPREELPSETAQEAPRGRILRGRPIVGFAVGRRGVPAAGEGAEGAFGPEAEDEGDDEPTGAIRVPSAGGDGPAPLGQEPASIEPAEEGLPRLPEMDEELASADEADLPQAEPLAADDVDDVDGSAAPASPLRVAPHRPLRAGARPIEVAPGQLRPLDGAISSDGCSAMDDALDDDGVSWAVEEPEEERTGVLSPEPVVGRKGAGSTAERPGRLPKIVAAVLVCACIAVAAVAVARSGILPSSQEGAGTGAASEEARASSDGTAAETGPVATLPEAAKSFSDYSWSELAGIAQAIEETSSREEALSVAARYGLCDADGTISSDTRKISFKDGTAAEVHIADIYVDDREAGGKAGITFLVTGSGLTHAMNAAATTEGGWEGSDMRSWLAQEVLPQLPDDLASFIVPVTKLTNNVGYTASASSVTATSDSLWIPSFTEVFGEISWNWLSSSSAAYNEILSSEGVQYAVFSEAGIASGMGTAEGIESASGIGAEGSSWWLRSASPSASDHFRSVSGTSGPYSVDDAAEALSVVFGFCL